ncbi:phosphorylase family protein [Rubripirellula reticaptiva]|uniref:5'-methylthioadenosine/S-adenosylhomocysteine nucleosidase n=1 Tax=Rubripirellula reticaptiva TaxID=2528013 RepID=A0A5C6EGZ6_9BACT|nr:response regulator [Rubripirellula reticaptiva]TWU46509.1 5'-methylthioadenosine/S-adenosylhomocysteine nucleosidase [Rubripirellula reticaptiva]
MLNVLIVDDDSVKQAKIEQVIRSHVFCDLELKVVPCQAAALEELRSNHFDLMVLDINLPRGASDNPVSDGGIRLLKTLDKHKEFNSPQHVVGLTAYEELAAKNASLFNSSMRFLITYKASSSDWQSRLSTLVVNIVAAKPDAEDANYLCDLAILTALQSPELDAVLKLDADWVQLPQSIGDAFCFHRGTFKLDNKKLSVISASATRMGMPAATVLTCLAIERFRPRYLAMAGIAAGVKGNFGDVLVADRTWDYGSGKSRNSGRWFARTQFDPDPHQISTDDGLLSRISLFRSQNREMLRQLAQDWNGSVEHTPEILIGPVASGASVLENRPAIEAIKRNNRKLIGIEMETYGVYLAAALATSPRPVVFSAKAICDFGDNRKNDRMQEFAAYMSAQVLHAFAVQHLC